jgi:hypothetical protein
MVSAPLPSPGWYPDPSGAPRRRYWDGQQWAPDPPPKRSGRAALFAVLGLLGFFGILVAGMIFASHVFGPSPSASAEDVIGTCQDAVRKGLRDPDSARFEGWEAHKVDGPAPRGLPYSDGDAIFSASGKVNAKNGFGGYEGAELINCDAVANPSGTIHAQAGPAYLPKP